jgi:hypothetical protein
MLLESTPLRRGSFERVLSPNDARWPRSVRSMTDVITCPSGLTGRRRGMRVREERVLVDRKLAKGEAKVRPYCLRAGADARCSLPLCLRSWVPRPVAPDIRTDVVDEIRRGRVGQRRR